MKACIILHNMIIKDKRGLGLEDPAAPEGVFVPTTEPSGNSNTVDDDEEVVVDQTLAAFTERHVQLRNEAVHYHLRNDLVDHQWNRKGEQL